MQTERLLLWVITWGEIPSTHSSSFSDFVVVVSVITILLIIIIIIISFDVTVVLVIRAIVIIIIIIIMINFINNIIIVMIAIIINVLVIIYTTIFPPPTSRSLSSSCLHANVFISLTNCCLSHFSTSPLLPPYHRQSRKRKYTSATLSIPPHIINYNSSPSISTSTNSLSLFFTIEYYHHH